MDSNGSDDLPSPPPTDLMLPLDPALPASGVRTEAQLDAAMASAEAGEGAGNPGGIGLPPDRPEGAMPLPPICRR